MVVAVKRDSLARAARPGKSQLFVSLAPKRSIVQCVSQSASRGPVEIELTLEGQLRASSHTHTQSKFELRLLLQLHTESSAVLICDQVVSVQFCSIPFYLPLLLLLLLAAVEALRWTLDAKIDGTGKG